MERNLIFCFSGTGNSLKAAKDIAGPLKNCEIVSMGKPYELNGPYDRIGFVFPSYAMGTPPVVKKFVKGLDLLDYRQTYFFAVVTCGQSPGNSINTIVKLLRRKGVFLSYGREVAMFSNFVALYDMAGDPEEKANEASRELKPIASDIIRKKDHAFPEGGNPALSLIHGIFCATLATRDEKFRVGEVCDGCGACSKICPVGNIGMENGKPMYRHGCQQCMACIQWCPRRAIEYGEKTKERGRYHHPGIELAEMVRLAQGSIAPSSVNN